MMFSELHSDQSHEAPVALSLIVYSPGDKVNVEEVASGGTDPEKLNIIATIRVPVF